MEFDKLSHLLLDGLGHRLENNRGLDIVAAQRADFAGWLIVETCRVLNDAGIVPELDTHKFDIGFGEWAVNIRTVSTGFSHPRALHIKRSITRGVEMLIKDILKVANPGRAVGFAKRGILFVVSPLEHDNDQWQSIHLKQISGELTRLESRPFRFEVGIPGVLYFGLCSATG